MSSRRISTWMDTVWWCPVSPGACPRSRLRVMHDACACSLHAPTTDAAVLVHLSVWACREFSSYLDVDGHSVVVSCVPRYPYNYARLCYIYIYFFVIELHAVYTLRLYTDAHLVHATSACRDAAFLLTQDIYIACRRVARLAHGPRVRAFNRALLPEL